MLCAVSKSLWSKLRRKVNKSCLLMVLYRPWIHKSIFSFFFKVNKLSALTYRKVMTTDKRADALFRYVDCSLGKHIALNKVPNTKCLHLLNQIKVNPVQNMLEVLVELFMKSLHRIENLTSLLSTH